MELATLTEIESVTRKIDSHGVLWMHAIENNYYVSRHQPMMSYAMQMRPPVAESPQHCYMARGPRLIHSKCS